MRGEKEREVWLWPDKPGRGGEQLVRDWRCYNMITATAHLLLSLLLAAPSLARVSQEPLSSRDLSIIRGSDQRKILNVEDGSICVLLKRSEDGAGNIKYILMLPVFK